MYINDINHICFQYDKFNNYYDNIMLFINFVSSHFETSYLSHMHVIFSPAIACNSLALCSLQRSIIFAIEPLY